MGCVRTLVLAAWLKVFGHVVSCRGTFVACFQHPSRERTLRLLQAVCHSGQCVFIFRYQNLCRRPHLRPSSLGQGGSDMHLEDPKPCWTIRALLIVPGTVADQTVFPVVFVFLLQGGSDLHLEGFQALLNPYCVLTCARHRR